MARTAPVTRHRTQQERLAALEPLLPKFRERRRRYDDGAAFPSENFADLRRAGLLGNSLPREYGGNDFWLKNFVDYYEIYEKIAAVCSSTAQLYQIENHGIGMLAWHATPAQREQYLPEIAERGLLVASVGSEADPTSEGAPSGRAELYRASDGWRLTCYKHFASLGPGADYLLVWTALPGEGSWASRQVWVLVPAHAPGVEMIDEWDVMGMRATASWAVRLTDYPVAEGAIIGQPGAWAADPRSFTLGYVTNHVGTAQGAFDLACDYVRRRRYLADNPIIRVALGELSSHLAVNRAALYAAARLYEAAAAAGWDDVLVDQAELLSLQALHVSKQVALEVTRRVFDICGARAAFRTYPFEAMYRDVRTFTLHHRDFDYMLRVATAILEGTDTLRAVPYVGGDAPPGPLNLPVSPV